MLWERAVERELGEFWDGRKEKGPPTSFILPKNKMEEDGDDPSKMWKMRVLFNHFPHILKKRGRLVGRGLTFLLKEAYM
jgi:hypothetical protein